SRRIERIWADGSINKTLIEFTVLANSNTGLQAPDVFYFGNALADSGTGDTSTQATVDVTDEIGARNHPQSLLNNIPITNIYDYNRDGSVDISDQLAARNNPTNGTTVARLLHLVIPPAVRL